MRTDETLLIQSPLMILLIDPTPSLIPADSLCGENQLTLGFQWQQFQTHDTPDSQCCAV